MPLADAVFARRAWRFAGPAAVQWAPRSLTGCPTDHLANELAREYIRLMKQAAAVSPCPIPATTKVREDNNQDRYLSEVQDRQQGQAVRCGLGR
jgi:hypothetical protein